MKYSRAIAIWERSALDPQKKLALTGTEAERESMAKEIVRYAVTELLEWTPTEAMEHMTEEVMNQMNLNVLVDQKFLQLPIDCLKQDYDYIIAYCFDRKPDYMKQLMRYYHKIQAKEIPKFPKGLFNGEYGRIKAGYLLGDFIAKRISVSADPGIPNDRRNKLYERFADYAAMNRLLSKAEIYDVCHRLYSNPLEYLHYSLKDDERDDFLFSFYEFENVYKETKKSINATH